MGYFTNRIFLLVTCLILIQSFSWGQISTISMTNGALIPAEKTAFSPILHKGNLVNGDYFVAIQLQKDLSIQDVRTILDCDFTVMTRFDQHTFLIRTGQLCLDKLVKEPIILTVFDIPASFKIDASLLSSNHKQVIKTRISLYGKETIKAFEQRWPGLKRSEVSSNEKFSFLTIETFSDRLYEIAALPYVAHLSFRPDEYSPINFHKRSHESVQGANADASIGGLGLNGNGITIGHGDAGRYTHADLDDRVWQFAGNIVHNHASHTAGTMAGAGNIEPRNRGLADAATLINAYFYDIVVQAPSFYNNYQMRVTNNSYSMVPATVTCDFTGGYNDYSREIDASTEEFTDLLHVWAAGNSGAVNCTPYPNGYKSILSGPQSSKNGISVGALSNGNGTPLTSYSSRGPTNDGRIKPEISTIGGSTLSANSNNGYYSTGGTSMAAPSVSAAVGLIQEAYKSSHGNVYPRADLIKAILINTSEDVGAEGPDYQRGFGKLNIHKGAKHTLTGSHFTGIVTEEGQQDFSFTVPANTGKLAVTLSWIDPPGNPLITKQLVNDLDLEVIGPGGTILPWTLNPTPSQVNQIAVRGVDTLNNIEHVSFLAPAPGTYIIRVKGTSVLGSQPFAVTGRLEANSLHIEAPFGGEIYEAGENMFIQWDCDNAYGSGFVLEFSSDNGSSWSPITTKGPADRNHFWTVPANITRQARIRVSHQGSLASDQSMAFTIGTRPGSFTATVACEGYADLSWNSVTDATKYRIYKKSGPAMMLVDSSLTNTHLMGGLTPGFQELIGVSAVFANGTESRRSTGVFVNASGGTCSWANDLTIQGVFSPGSGRKHTSLELSNAEVVEIQIKNLGATTASGFQVFYSFNGGTEVVEPFAGTIPPGSVSNHIFMTPVNMASIGTYNLTTGIYGSPDAPFDDNNVISIAIRHLPNEPVLLGNTPESSFIEDFEEADIAVYEGNHFGLNQLTHFDFNSTQTTGRLRTFVSNDMANSGNRALTLDISTGGVTAGNEIRMTVNLENYTSADNLRLNFAYLNHNNADHPGNRVWIRGNDTDPWIEIYNLYTNQAAAGQYKNIWGLDISSPLIAHGQQVSSSTQIKFGQQGNGSVISPSSDQGYTFDDISIHKVASDVALANIVSPLPINCGLSANETVTISIANTASGDIQDVQAFYRLNNGVTQGPFNVGSIPGNTTLIYSLINVDLSNIQQHLLDVWVTSPEDIFTSNDSLLGYSIRNKGVISQFPHLEDFENGPGGWYAEGQNASWAFGTPIKPKLNGAASGSNAWATGLASNYNDNETSYLISPCLDLSGFTANPMISFSMAYEIEANYDIGRVEVSEMDGPWIKLGEISTGTNWYNKTGGWDGTKSHWHVTSHSIPLNLFTDKSQVAIRIVLVTDGGLRQEGIAIDDIHIFEPQSIYQGGNIVVQNTPSDTWTPFYSPGNQLVAAIKTNNGQNLGNTTISTYFNPGTTPRHTATQYYLDRNFTIEPDQALTSGTVEVRLFFTDVESEALRNAPTGYDKPKDAYKLGVTHLSSDTDDGIPGNEINGVVDYYNYSESQLVPFSTGYYIQFTVDRFSEFYLNSGGIQHDQPLPIEIIYFKATPEEGSEIGRIDYRLAPTDIPYHVSIQRSRNPNFENRVDIDVRTTTTQDVTVYDDEKGKEGRYYYRLKINTVDGRETFSHIATLEYRQPWSVNVLQQLSGGEFHLNFKGLEVGKQVFIDTYNMHGMREKTMEFFPKYSTEQKLISLAGLNDGVYILLIRHHSKQVPLKVILLKN